MARKKKVTIKGYAELCDEHGIKATVKQITDKVMHGSLESFKEGNRRMLYWHGPDQAQEDCKNLQGPRKKKTKKGRKKKRKSKETTIPVSKIDTLIELTEDRPLSIAECYELFNEAEEKGILILK